MNLSPPRPISSGQGERIGFRYIWPVRIVQRQLNHNEAIILHISPKIATVYDHVAFQWSVKMHGSANLDTTGDESADSPSCTDYIAFSLYYVDGPTQTVDVFSNINVLSSDYHHAHSFTHPGPHITKPLIDKPDTVVAMHCSRGSETELEQSDRSKLSTIIKGRIGKIVRLSVYLEIEASLFKTDCYLNAVSPTPVHSFLTANYRARVRSKVWRKKSKHGHSTKRLKPCIENDYKRDIEEIFNRVMDHERDRLEAERVEEEKIRSTRSPPRVLISAPPDANERKEHLFKKVLIACCDSCKRRASTISMTSNEDHDTGDDDDGSGGSESDDEDEDCGVDTTFECPEANKAAIHDMLATMYFNKIALPDMEYVEDFADFLIDAELNDLPVLKRACERYLCGELNSKKDLLTSLLLDLLFLAIMFRLPVMRSMTLTELTERHEDMVDVNELLKEDVYKNLDKRIRQMSDRTLADLIDECKKFREQRRRVEVMDSSSLSSASSTP